MTSYLSVIQIFPPHLHECLLCLAPWMKEYYKRTISDLAVLIVLLGNNFKTAHSILQLSVQP